MNLAKSWLLYRADTLVYKFLKDIFVDISTFRKPFLFEGMTYYYRVEKSCESCSCLRFACVFIHRNFHNLGHLTIAPGIDLNSAG